MDSVYKYHELKGWAIAHLPKEDNILRGKKENHSIKEAFFGGIEHSETLLFSLIKPALVSNCLGLHKPVGEPQHHCGKPFSTSL